MNNTVLSSFAAVMNRSGQFDEMRPITSSAQNMAVFSSFYKASRNEIRGFDPVKHATSDSTGLDTSFP
jgi:hypothetical protein